MCVVFICVGIVVFLLVDYNINIMFLCYFFRFLFYLNKCIVENFGYK